MSENRTFEGRPLCPEGVSPCPKIGLLRDVPVYHYYALLNFYGLCVKYPGLEFPVDGSIVPSIQAYFADTLLESYRVPLPPTSLGLSLNI